MRPRSIISFIFSVFILIVPVLVYPSWAKPVGTPAYKSQEVDEKDGVPVLIEHLPSWESVRNKTTFAREMGPIKRALGPRPVLDVVEFTPGTEAVTAPYDSGKLLIVEFSSPEVSVETDARITAKLAEQTEEGLTVYRRIGNYNAFVFDAKDEASANALLDQIKYEKMVTWLSGDPNIIQRAERVFVLQTSSLFLSTVLVILIGLGTSVATGIIIGLVFFRIRERQRAAWSTFTDAGGMTRLNLDGFTPEILPERLLKD